MSDDARILDPIAGAIFGGQNTLEHPVDTPSCGTTFVGCSAYRASFKGQALRGANFQGAYLARVSFVGADLREADMSGAILCGADFRLATITGMIVEQAVLLPLRCDKECEDEQRCPHYKGPEVN